MRPTLIIAVCLVATSTCVPQDGKTDTRVGLDRPSTEKPPDVNEADLDSTLCAVFGTCETGGNNNQQQPDNNDQRLPDNNNYPGSNTGNNYPDSNIGDSYKPTTESYQPPPDQPYGPPGGGDGSCSCVQYYLCNENNNTINEDGVGLIDIRIKDEECKDYLEKCCGGEHIIEQPITPKPTQRPIARESYCGIRNPEGIGFRITGNNDNEAQYGEFPWMVAVIRPDSNNNEHGKSVSVYQCGGSLIHPQVVLTGAHCVHGKENLLIRAGEWDTQTKNELYPTQDRKVKQVIIHEQFNSGTLANDPALLILDKPVDMKEQNVGLICLPEANENMDGRHCVASGWGKDLFGKEGKYQVILKRVELPMVQRSRCLELLRKTRLGPRFKLHESFVCAGGIPGKDTCKGDGGSPLVCPSKNNPNVYVQAGIVAWGIDCSTETPGVYASVPYFVNWIHNKLAAHGINLDNH